MKTIYQAILTILILTIAITGFVLNDNSNLNKKINYPSLLDLKGIRDTKIADKVYDPDLQNSDWYSEAMNNLSEMEYNISFSEEIKSYQSPNRANNMRFIYHKDGFTALTRDSRSEMQDDWSIKFKVESSKFKDQSINSGLSSTHVPGGDPINQSVNNSSILSSSTFHTSGNKASIEDDNLRIDYTNDKNGMRQDFIIKKRPEREGKLRLNLTADTKLTMILGADALIFKDKKGNDKLKYSSLKCWDANGKELRAYFDKNYELGIRNSELKNKSKIKNRKSKIETNSKSEIPNSKFDIVVNDEDAVYPITIDPLSENPAWTFESNQAGSTLGFSVAAAGDVNGDGYSDVIAGAPNYDNGQTGEGRAYVFHGSATGLSTFANWVAESDTAMSNFGYSVATAGDVNGDGYSDVIIGAPGWNSTGKVYVFHGSSSGLSVINNWQKQISQTDAGFGTSVSTAGDINNDGYSDVIVGSPNAHDGQSDEGRANIYLGTSSGLSNSIHKRLEINSANANFGFSVSLAGDVNGDGYSDVIIGAPKYTAGQTEEGRAYIYKGTSSGIDSIAFWINESNQANSEYGISVSSAGDVNGDGLSDVIVGASDYEDDSTNEGKAFVFYGNASTMSTTAAWTKDIDQRFAFFGHSVGTAGDVNGDGYADILIGAYGFTNGESDEGKVFVFFGSSAGLSASDDWNEEINQVSAFFGTSVATAGDINGDGFSDIIVGAIQYDNGQSNEGKVFLYTGYADGLRTTENWTYEINSIYANFGCSVASAGDINGDGYGDVIVGAEFYSNGENSEGAAFVFTGSSTGLSNFPGWSFESNQAEAIFGSSVSTAGDVNGDGYSDVIIGAKQFDNGQNNEGTAFLFYGSSSGLSINIGWTGESNQTAALYGSSVSTAGDVNGDGYSDVIIGSPNFNNGQINEGRTFVYYGSASGLSNVNWSTESNQVSAWFGYSVSSAGDVNGDGYSDVIIGSPFYDNGENDEGRVYVFHGSASGLSLSVNWTNDINNVGANYGYSVSTAGDVNADGYSDVIIGAPFYSNGQTYEGAVIVYNGSSTGLSAVPHKFFQSNLENAYDGKCVSFAGDVNGDGYSDVIIGDPHPAIVSNGVVYLIYGSESGLVNYGDWRKQGEQLYSHYGTSVSSAGDINGDGYTDIIIGSPGFDNGQNEEGKTFVFYGNRKTGVRSTVQQYEPSSNNIISSGGISESNGNVKLNLFGKSSIGRSKGKIVYEYKQNGFPFSGSVITNSTLSSGSGNMIDLGTSGIDLSNEVSGLLSDKEYKWRARVQYDLVKSPYQKYGPWKYYSNYITSPLGGFKPKTGPITLNLSALIEGFYNSASDVMIADTVKVYLRNSASPYNSADSAVTVINSAGTGTLTFLNATSGTGYFFVIKHRNSIETWSASAQVFTSGIFTYDFTIASSKAYGNNMVQADVSPVVFAIFGGDVNQDGYVNLSDVILTYNDANAFVTGYKDSDVTGNNITDLSDVILTYNNSNKFVAKITP